MSMSEPISTGVMADHPASSQQAAIGVDALLDALYARLKAMASRQLAAQPSATLDTTALVHELYLRIGTVPGLGFSHPAQFFAYAARAMRHLLRDRARDRLRLKAGGAWARVTLDGNVQLAIDSAEELLALEEAMLQLADADPRAARVVELRYYAGLSLEQTAEMLGLARRTVDRDWRFARAFLNERLG
jgi:RNA polymerase sigma factor (TIGR02999 family)